MAEEATTQAIYGAIAAKLDGVTKVLGSPTELEIGDGAHGPISSWFDVFRICQVGVPLLPRPSPVFRSGSTRYLLSALLATPLSSLHARPGRFGSVMVIGCGSTNQALGLALRSVLKWRPASQRRCGL